MRLLADENIPLETVRALRAAGHDVYSATETTPGIPDQALIDLATHEDRLIVTFDRDFGELAIRHERRPAAGVVLLRFTPANAHAVTELMTGLLSRADVVWRERLSVVDGTHIRQRPF